MKGDLNEDDEVYKSQRLPQVPDTPMAGGGISLVTFKEPVSSTPHVRLCPTAVALSGVFSPETSDKETEEEIFRHCQPWIKGYEGEARIKTDTIARVIQEKSTVAHSLQLAVEEFKKIREPKISKLKEGYLANAMLVFHSWLKDTKMCIQKGDSWIWRQSNLLKIIPVIMPEVWWNFI